MYYCSGMEYCRDTIGFNYNFIIWQLSNLTVLKLAIQMVKAFSRKNKGI